MKRFFKKIHLWLSLPAGIVIMLTCLTGAIMVFQDEIQELCFPKRYKVSDYENRTPLSFSELVPIVNAQLADNEVATIQLYPDPASTYRIGLKKGRRVTAFVNPYTGEVVAVSDFTKSFFGLVMFLHRWLMLKGDARETGKIIVGISTIFFVFILISGIVIWIPRNRKQFRSAFSLKFKGNKRNVWYNLHRVLGIYAVLILLLLALTGLMWSFDWYREGVTNIVAKDKDTLKPTMPPPAGDSRGDGKSEKPQEEAIDYSLWEKALASLPASYNYVYARIDNGSINTLPKSAWHDRAIDQFSFDTESGEITQFRPFKERSARGKVMSVNYVLHTGRFGGFFVKVLFFIAALIGALLPITGYWMWWTRTLRKKRSISA